MSTQFLSSHCWYHQKGPMQETVLYSRVRALRNLQGHPFFLDSSSVGGRSLIQRFRESLDQWDQQQSAQCYNLKDFSPLERRILLERQILETGGSYKEFYPFFMGMDEALSGTLLGQDHLKMSCFRGGLDLKGAWEILKPLDEHLENDLQFAVSPQWGYLTCDPRQGGCGLKASVLMHLPGVEELDMVDRVYKTAESLGFSVRGFWGDGEGSLGDLYQISNQVSAGFSPQEILEGTHLLAEKIHRIETRARESVFQKRRNQLEDKVWRAYGKLKYARQIGYQEALSVLSSLRFGAIVGILKGVDPHRLSMMFYQVQKGHLAGELGQELEQGDERSYDFERVLWMQRHLGLLQGDENV